MIRLLPILLVAGCATVPDPECFWTHGVETRPQYQRPVSQCDVIHHVRVNRRELNEICAGAWGCGRVEILSADEFGPDPQAVGDHGAQVVCTLYYYDDFVLVHERCHLRHGREHAKALTLEDFVGGG